MRAFVAGMRGFVRGFVITIVLIAAAITVWLIVLNSSRGSGGAKHLPLAVFFRAQTSSDAVWWERERRTVLKGLGRGKVVPPSFRSAQTTPWGTPVFVDLDRQSTTDPSTPFTLAWSSTQAGAPLSAVSDGGFATAVSSGGAYFPPPGVDARSAVTRFVLLVPNHVARIRFAYAGAGPSRTVRVRGNVAAVQFRQPCCVIEPEMTWYAADGSVIGHHQVNVSSLGRLAAPRLS
jgi:hypothetical protein